MTVGQEVAKVELGEGGSGGAKPESKPAASGEGRNLKKNQKEAPQGTAKGRTKESCEAGDPAYQPA